MDPIVSLDATELSALIARREVSCVEVMTAYLDHIEALNPVVNAIVNLRPRAELLAEAAAKDEAGGGGWMHGFPHAVKDLSDAAGLPSTYGFLRGHVDPVDTDSIMAARIRAAGAIVIGKTNTPEFGLGSHTYNTVFGTTVNAYDQSRSAGGSSGGAAVAVALRMLPVADGSDFMGSLRNPPGWNNVFGLRPSPGRVPSDGGDLFVAQAGVEGPIARTGADLAALTRTMAGYDARSPLSLQDELTQTSPGTRVAWLGDLGGYLPIEPEVLSVTTAALSGFASLGMSVTPVPALPTYGTFRSVDDLWPTWLTFRHWLVGMGLKDVWDDPAARAGLKPEALFELEPIVSGRLSAEDVYRASVRRSDLYEAFRRFFERYDYVVLPTAQLFPFPASAHWPSRINDVEMSTYHRWMEVTAIGTLINAPVLALPAGFSASGLPIGLQVIARNHDDASLLSLASAWHEATGWSDRLPPLLTR